MGIKTGFGLKMAKKWQMMPNGVIAGMSRSR